MTLRLEFERTPVAGIYTARNAAGERLGTLRQDGKRGWLFIALTGATGRARTRTGAVEAAGARWRPRIERLCDIEASL